MNHIWKVGRTHVEDHPFITILIIAVAVRLVLMPLLTYDYDIYHWGLIIENIQSGNGLYETAGYYYTPVWGYILGSLSMVMDLFLQVDVFGNHFTDLIPVENLICKFHISTITTIEFNLFIKTFLIIIDVLVAAVLYRFTEEFTSDRSKALTASCLWLFSLPVIYMSAIQAQFDSISALLLLLTVYLVYKDRTFLGGMMFATAVLLKFFPAFCIIVFIGYVYVKHKDDGMGIRKIAEAVVGAGLMAAIIVMPQILDGTWADALSFVTGRMDRNTDLLTTVWSYLGMALMIGGMIFTGMRMLKTRHDLDVNFVKYTMIALVLATVTSFTPQYFLVFLPLLCMFVADGSRGLRRIWAVVTVGAFIAALTINNASLLLSLSEYTELVSSGWVVSAMEWMESVTVGGMTSVSILNSIGNIIQFIGLASIIVYYSKDWISERTGRLDRMLSWMSDE